jgi:hypothetical protein
MDLINMQIKPRIRVIRGAPAGTSAGGQKTARRLKLPHPGLWRGLSGRNALRGSRVLAGTLCGLGVALFPGLAVLALQACLVLVWIYVMVSLVVSGLR